MSAENKKSFTKIVLKDNHLVNGKIVPKGHIILFKKK